jgi:hypothetical protein
MATAGGIGLIDIGLIDTSKVFFYFIFWMNEINWKFDSLWFDHVHQADMEFGSQSFRELLDRHTNIELILSTGPLLSDSIKMNETGSQIHSFGPWKIFANEIPFHKILKTVVHAFRLALSNDNSLEAF